MRVGMNLFAGRRLHLQRINRDSVKYMNHASVGGQMAVFSPLVIARAGIYAARQ
jgi:hypothetical protein